MTTNTSIHALFEKQVSLNPHNIALCWDKNSLTYQELNNKANQLAHYLLKRNLKPDTPVAFCMDRSFECLITMLAILKAGAGYLPIDPDHPKERLLYILKNSKTSFLLTYSNLKNQFNSFRKEIICLDEQWKEIEEESTDNPNLAISPEQLAYIIYTSGSTGNPKGVLIEHRSVVNYCFWFKQYSKIKKNQRIDFSSNHTFDMAVTLTLVPLMLGLMIVIADDAMRKNINGYLDYLNRFKIDLIKMTPSFFKVLLQEVQSQFRPLPYLKTIILGGENLLAKDCRSWLKLYPDHYLYNEYGPTETTVGVTQYAIGTKTLSDSMINVPIGTLGTRMYGAIIDPNGNPVKKGDAGELYLGGISLARGYLNQGKRTSEQFVYLSLNEKTLLGDKKESKKPDRFYKTGDLCRLREDGVLEYLGRIDSQIKIRGFRIEPGEIEKHIASYSSIKDVRVALQKSTQNEDRLIAYYILKEEYSNPASNDLRHYLRQYIPEYMIPSLFICVKSFPLTANGKLDLSLLPVTLVTNSPALPRKTLSPLEKMLVEIWSDELGIENIGLDDDFFELGGHSLSAARMISKINRIKNTRLDLQDFYPVPTIAQLSKLLEKAKKAPAVQQRNKEIYKKTELPLSNFQLMLWISVTFKPKAKKLNISTRKRLEGELDTDALEFAFNAVLKKQEVLFYQISSLQPIQKIQKKAPFKITKINLQDLSKEEAERTLKKSMKQMIHYYPWPKNAPLLKARLFYLSNNNIELQITIPHIVCDDQSPEILLSDLSQFYFLYKNQSKFHIEKSTPFKKYIFNEQDYIQKHLDRDIQFWNNYFKDAGLFKFPSPLVENKMKSKKIPYSTFTKIPETKLNQLKKFCAQRQISLNEGLCAVLALALKHCVSDMHQQAPYIYMSRVKSTRTNEDYDETIGCFLRIEPVKITLNHTSSLNSILQDIHQSILETNPYQKSSDLIKLSSVKTFRQKENTFKDLVISAFTSIYSALFSLSEMNRKIFKIFVKRLSLFDLPTDFMININIQSNFIIQSQKQEERLFGLSDKPVSQEQYDLLSIDNVFDVCFLREDEAPYLVISANLKPDFRQQVAVETIRIMGSVDH